jgi:hypothetical protein
VNQCHRKAADTAERRARVIAANGEYQASAKLAQAADAMGDTPGALQLRLLQTVVDVAAEKNSTLVMPFPVEMLRFFDRANTTDSPVVVAEPPAEPPAQPSAEATNGHPVALTR